MQHQHPSHMKLDGHVPWLLLQFRNTSATGLDPPRRGCFTRTLFYFDIVKERLEMASVAHVSHTEATNNLTTHSPSSLPWILCSNSRCERSLPGQQDRQQDRRRNSLHDGRRRPWSAAGPSRSIAAVGQKFQGPRHCRTRVLPCSWKKGQKPSDRTGTCRRVPSERQKNAMPSFFERHPKQFPIFQSRQQWFRSSGHG